MHLTVFDFIKLHVNARLLLSGAEAKIFSVNSIAN